MNILPCMREWYQQRVVRPAQRRNDLIDIRAREIMYEWPGLTLEEATDDATEEFSQRAKAAKVRTPVTELEARAIVAIAPGNVTYIPGIGTKRFARDIQGASQLTDAQHAYVWKIVWKFRRQIKDQALVAEAQRRGGVA